MKVFLSWSGERSRQAAEVFEDYLPKIFPNCEVFHSPEIEKGAEWFSEIMEGLRESNVGVIFLTKENISSDWVLFETGAMAIGLGDEESRACPFLLDYKTTDVSGPIAELELTENSKEDIRRLIETINNFSKSGYSSQDLEEVFETWWPKIEEGLNSIEEMTDEERDEEERDSHEMLEEVLRRVRNLDKSSAEEEGDALVSETLDEKERLIEVTEKFHYGGKEYEKGSFAILSLTIFTLFSQSTFI